MAVTHYSSACHTENIFACTQNENREYLQVKRNPELGSTIDHYNLGRTVRKATREKIQSPRNGAAFGTEAPQTPLPMAFYVFFCRPIIVAVKVSDLPLPALGVCAAEENFPILGVANILPVSIYCLVTRSTRSKKDF